MAKLTIEIPDLLLQLAQEQADLLGYADAADYIVAMLSDLEWNRWTKAELEAALLKGLNSGPPVVADEAFWADVDAHLRENLQSQRKKELP